jgi:hypothetical protein
MSNPRIIDFSFVYDIINSSYCDSMVALRMNLSYYSACFFLKRSPIVLMNESLNKHR